MIQYFSFTYCKLVSFTTHIFNKNRKVKLTTAGYFEAVCIFCLFYTKADICVQLTEKTVTQMAGCNEFAFLSCKWTVVYDELHRDRWLGNLLERNSFRVFRRAECISNGNICDSGYSDNRSDRSFFYFHTVQPVKFIELTNLYTLLFVRIMMVYNNHILVHGNCTVFYFTNSDTTNIFIVVDRADQHLGRSFRITFRSRNVIKDCLEQWFHILFLVREIKDSNTSFCRSIYKRALKLFI